MLFSTGRPVGGTGVQVAMTYPNSLPFNVWFEGEIVRFCETGAQAWGWLTILRTRGVSAIDELQEIAGGLAFISDAVPFSELRRKSEDGS